jgi:hypothetical protein
LVGQIKPRGTAIAGVKLSISNPNVVYIADHGGSVELWDWIEHQKLFSVDSGGQIEAFDVSDSSDDVERVFVLNSEKSDSVTEHDYVHLHTFTVQDHKPSSVSRLYSTKQELRHLQVYCSGGFVLLASSSRVILGMSEDQRTEAEDIGTSQYKWRELAFPQLLSYLHGHLHHHWIKSKKELRKQSKKIESLDLVIGAEEGSIFVYRDIPKLFQGSGLENISTPQKLHWHRNRVESVKWSTDGRQEIFRPNQCD